MRAYNSINISLCNHAFVSMQYSIYRCMPKIAMLLYSPLPNFCSSLIPSMMVNVGGCKGGAGLLPPRLKWYHSALPPRSAAAVAANVERTPYLRLRSSKREAADVGEVIKRSWRDYFELAKLFVSSESGGGGCSGSPRWFSPLESGSRSRMNNSPILLYLPGLDGVGLGLVSQLQKLSKMFDVWCLHIPVKDRTPFEELILLVEETVRSEHDLSPGRPIYLVGESFGGCLALAVAARNPDIDLVLILANPATSYDKSHLRFLLPLLEFIPSELSLINLPYTLRLITGGLLNLVSYVVKKALERQVAVEQVSQGFDELSAYSSVLADILPRDTLLWKLQMIKSAASFANSYLHAVKAQILILVSKRDPILPSLEEAERICEALPKQEIRVLENVGKMPKCEIRKVNGSGHFLFLADGVDLVTFIKRTNLYRRAKIHDYVSDYVSPTEAEGNKIYERSRWFDIATGLVMLSTLENGRVVRGLAGIPTEGPVLFVSNHMFLGSDLYPIALNFMLEKKILLRGLAHPMMFSKLREDQLDISIFDDFRILGIAPVSGSSLYKLLSSGSHVLLYPGGVREAFHKKGEEYQLFWPERSEFVRIAARFGAKIVPFGVVGEDDIFKLLVDYDDQMKIPFLRRFIEKNQAIRLRTDSEGELANQIGYIPGILPKFPGRFYYLFGKPIDTAGMKQELRDKEKAQEVYMQVKSEVERCISYLKKNREKDPYRSLAARTLYKAMHGWTTDVPTFEL